MPSNRNDRIALAAITAALMLALAPPAFADAARGQRLFNQFCTACHSPRPGDPVAAGAGSPDGIRSALQSVPVMQGIRDLLETADIADIADFLAMRFNVPPLRPPSLPVAQLTAVEFHHAALDHYFVTASPPEIAALDAGTVLRGWLRTGATFAAWPTSAAIAGASPVCRFYLPPGFGDSHFYSASPAECDEVRRRFPQFSYESAEVMAVALPDLTTGACPASTQAVFRLWNLRVDSNHRYVTTLAARDAMIASGFVSEGYGPSGVAFCAPT